MALVTVAVASLTARAYADLRADELLLLVNANVPQSGELAARYTAARGVPAGRVLPLDLPAGEELSPTDYDSRIAKPVRDYLATPSGRGVRCLVTFYGVPIRVTARTSTPEDQADVRTLNTLLADLDRRSVGLAKTMDDAARAGGVSPPASAVTNVATAREHIAETTRLVQTAIAADPAKQGRIADGFRAAQQASIAAALEALGPGPAAEPVLPPDQLRALLDRPRDAATRAAARRQVARAAGVFALYEVAASQAVWINADESDASVDNELALVRLGDYPKFRWQPNPLNVRAAPTPAARDALLMVSRIDAPTPQLTAKLIDDGIAVEKNGLDGRAVFDGRGLPPTKDGKPDGYGVFDQYLRDAAAFVKTKTAVPVVADDREPLIPPRDVPGTAVYCGWYSLRRYVPSCGFVRGAVGYHVASFEMVSLHEPRETGWVANLIKDGVVATVGPVSEPYLSAFPRPDEFLPLLMTGRPTLAEAYWATCPMTSWKMALIGDPLYRPFAAKPAVKAADLPEPARGWVEKLATPTPAGR